MATQVNPPRGMRDFLPAEKARRERVLTTIKARYRAHGFDEIETPVVEDWWRLTSGLGADNEKLAYAVLRRGISEEELREAERAEDLADLGLRFDLTVPLARFVASHRGELPTVFRAIQAAPVWRAERPQKGRYRQFVQCDIDVIGEPGPLAEAELLTASLDALGALGLAPADGSGASIRINDRRLLTGMLDRFGFAPEQRALTLVTLDKLDKLDAEGVVAELRERGADVAAVAALETFLTGPRPEGRVPVDERSILAALPEGANAEVVANLVGIGDAVRSATGRDALWFDPFLVRGMGYYSGPIFEVAHPAVPYSLGGGGRYDGMIGRFSGSEIPAAGFSLGFERLVELVEFDGADDAGSVALVHPAGLDAASLVPLKAALVAGGARVRLARRTKNLSGLLDQLAADGFTHWAPVDADSTPDALDLRALA